MRTNNTHPLDVGYLVMGLIFLGIVGVWTLHQADLVDLGEMDWLLPAGLIAAGAIGLVATGAKALSRRRNTAPDPAEQAYDEPGVHDEWAYSDHENTERTER